MWHHIENHIRILHRFYTCFMCLIMIIQRIGKDVISRTCLSYLIPLCLSTSLIPLLSLT